MDENFVERAEELVRAEIDAGIARSRNKPTRPVGFDGTCECGDEIAVKRIELGYYRCIECQSRTERLWRRN